MQKLPRLWSRIYIDASILPICASEAQRMFPLWDGHKSVAAYPERLIFPMTTPIDFGNSAALAITKFALSVTKARIAFSHGQFISVAEGFACIPCVSLIARIQGLNTP